MSMITVPKSEIAERVVSLQALLQKDEVDVAVVRQNADLFYFTGTVQDGYLIVPASGAPVFLVRRDSERATQQSPLRPILPLGSMKELPQAVFDACGESAPGRLGLELDVLPANTFFFFDEKLFPKQQIVDISGLVRQVRMVKSAWEIELMRRAGGISRAVADAVPKVLGEGMSELELMIELETVARRAGHLGLLRLRGFNMDMYFGHVLSGPEAAIPAYTDAPTGGQGVSAAFGQGASERRIRAGDMVSIDTMMNCEGYLSDQTRNFCIGNPPPRLEQAYRFAQEIHRRFREAARPGAVTGQLYDLVWQWVEEAGWAEWFMGYGAGRVAFIGHGLGIEVDEFPFIAQGQKLALQEGMTFAFEPKFILPGLGIAGLENTYLVTSVGLASLNTATEELVIIQERRNRTGEPSY
jgi:Xaa-Pro dipeptidase